MAPLRLVLPQYLLREKRNLQGWPRTRRTYTGAGRSDVREVLSPTSESRKLTKQNAAGAAFLRLMAARAQPVQHDARLCPPQLAGQPLPFESSPVE